MRLNESKLVEKSLADIGVNLEVYQEANNFSVATTKIPQKVVNLYSISLSQDVSFFVVL